MCLDNASSYIFLSELCEEGWSVAELKGGFNHEEDQDLLAGPDGEGEGTA